MTRLTLIACLLWAGVASAQPITQWPGGVTPPIMGIPSGANGAAITPTSVGVPASTCAAPGIYLTTATTTGMAFTATPSVIICVNGTAVVTTTATAVTSTVPIVLGTNNTAELRVLAADGTTPVYALWYDASNNLAFSGLSSGAKTASWYINGGNGNFLDNGNHVLGIGTTGSLTFGADVSLSRGAADLVIVGANDAIGMTSKAWISTAPSGPVACTSPAVTWSNGSAAFQIDVGSTCAGISTLVVTLPAVTNAYSCTATNVTTSATAAVEMTASTTTSATFTNYTRTTGVALAWADGADVRVSCTGG